MLKSFMFSNIQFFLEKRFPFNPWVYLLVFLISNTILSFFPLTPFLKFTVILFGLLLPWFLGLAVASQKSLREPNPLENAKVPLWIWLIALFLFLGSRFYHLTTLPFWPIPDEGWMSFLAIDQNSQWHWSFLFGEGRIESLILWLLAFFFKFEQPSLFSMRLFPALISISTIGTAYWATRQYLSQWFSFLLACLLGFSFFEWTLSRMISPQALGLLFLCAAFGILGKIKKEKDSFKRNLWFVSIVLCCALGFYSTTSWPACWLSIGLCLFGFTPGTLRQKMKMSCLFFSITLLSALPLISARLAPDGIAHLRAATKHFSPIQFYGYYIYGIFWSGISNFPFGPLRGGYLNPLYDSLTFLGTLEIVKEKGSQTFLSIFVFLFLFMAPGGLSGNVELHRILPALILLSWLAVWGIQSLLADLKLKKIIGVSALIILSFSFDFFHFAYRYCNPHFVPPDKQWRSIEYFNAYQTLKNLGDQTGPIYFFSEWSGGDFFNKTLSVACYPFDVTQNPRIVEKTPVWSAFLADVDYVPFLKKRFPHIQTQLLNPSLPPKDPHRLLGLFLIPVSDIPPPVLQNWLSSHRECQRLAFLIQNKNPAIPWELFEKDFARLAIQYTEDPFLASVLWEKAASFPLMDGNFAATASDFQQAVQKGYPVPHLLNNLKLASHFANSAVLKSQ